MIFYICFCLAGLGAVLSCGQGNHFICEDHSLSLNCSSAGVIQVTRADYGRNTANNTCGSTDPTPCPSNKTSLQKVKDLCDGNPTCDIPVNNSFFGDPCNRVKKYLELECQCVDEQATVTEGNNPVGAASVALIAGVTSAVVLLFLLVLVCILCYFCRRKKKSKNSNQCPPQNNVSEIEKPKISFSKNIRNKVRKLRQALKEEKELKKKKRKCDKHLNNLRMKDEEEFITINEIYEAYNRQTEDEEHEYSDIDLNKIYDVPLGDVIVQVFEDEERVKVRKIVEVLENEYETTEMKYYATIDEITGLVLESGAEEEDGDNIYEYIDISKLDEIKRANETRKEIKAEKGTAKNVVENLNSLEHDTIIPLEDIYSVPHKIRQKDENDKSNIASEETDNYVDDEIYSIYVKQVVVEKFGDRKEGKVKDLINVFEEKIETLKEEEHKVMERITEVVEEETNDLETKMVENEVYWEYNEGGNMNNEAEDTKKKQMNMELEEGPMSVKDLVVLFNTDKSCYEKKISKNVVIKPGVENLKENKLENDDQYS